MCCCCNMLATAGSDAAFITLDIAAVNLSLDHTALVLSLFLDFTRMNLSLNNTAFCFVLLRGRAIARPSCDYYF